MNKTPETDKLLGDLLAELGTIGRHNCPEKLVVHARRLEIERDEAQKELSSIHQWVDRNHPDGFIDSQTYFQNLERVVDNWYDRLDRLEVDANRFVRERDEAREDASHWKIEYEIVEARLCGGKHERDNGIVSEREIIPKLQRERDEARKELDQTKDALGDALVALALKNLLADQVKRERDEAREGGREMSDKL